MIANVSKLINDSVISFLVTILLKDDSNKWIMNHNTEYLTEWHHDEVEQNLAGKMKVASEISLMAELLI
jgi:ferric iron reductase protein FhuF